MRNTLLVFLVIIFTFIGISTIREKSNGDYVVILHGIARNADNMQNMASFLEAQGYDSINLDYPSTEFGLEELAKIMSAQLADKIILQSHGKIMHGV